MKDRLATRRKQRGEPSQIRHEQIVKERKKAELLASIDETIQLMGGLGNGCKVMVEPSLPRVPWARSEAIAAESTKSSSEPKYARAPIAN
jgi:hypothetical protein